MKDSDRILSCMALLNVCSTPTLRQSRCCLTRLNSELSRLMGVLCSQERLLARQAGERTVAGETHASCGRPAGSAW